MMDIDRAVSRKNKCEAETQEQNGTESHGVTEPAPRTVVLEADGAVSVTISPVGNSCYRELGSQTVRQSQHHSACQRAQVPHVSLSFLTFGAVTLWSYKYK